jgi:hypothetical protein
VTVTKYRCVPGCGRWLAEVDDASLRVVKSRRAVRGRYVVETAARPRPTTDGRTEFLDPGDPFLLDDLIARGVAVPTPERYSHLELVCDCKKRWRITRSVA